MTEADGALMLLCYQDEPVFALDDGDVVGTSARLGEVVLRTDDGTTWTYTGVSFDPAIVGARVAAGQRLGAVRRSAPGSSPASYVQLSARAPDGHPLDAVWIVAGLPDPAPCPEGSDNLWTWPDPDPVDLRVIEPGLEGK